MHEIVHNLGTKFNKQSIEVRQLQDSKELLKYIQQTKSLVLKLVLQTVTLLLGLRQFVEEPPILLPRPEPHLLCQLLQDRYACF